MSWSVQDFRRRISMGTSKYLYHINYQGYEDALCRLEMRSIFKLDVDGRTFVSNKKVNPSFSPFIKSSLEILIEAPSFENLLVQLEQKGIDSEGFKVIYMVYKEDDPFYSNRKELCKKVGLVFKGYPNFKSPTIIYGITMYEGQWIFGEVDLNNSLWRKHNDRPYTYSSSLGIHLAKSLVNIASEGDFNKTIIDPCCGVGTILLEAAFAGYNIVGRELALKVAKSAQKNLLHFDYNVPVTIGDINDITEKYDVAIVDLPYGIFTTIDATTQVDIIRNASRIASRIVLVSTGDLTEVIKENGLTLLDSCRIQKNEGNRFIRYVWVCGN